MKVMFGPENIYSFIDQLKMIIEKQKEQLKEQITSLEGFEKIQEQISVKLHIYQRDGEFEVQRIYKQPTINLNL